MFAEAEPQVATTASLVLVLALWCFGWEGKERQVKQLGSKPRINSVKEVLVLLKLKKYFYLWLQKGQDCSCFNPFKNSVNSKSR